MMAVAKGPSRSATQTLIDAVHDVDDPELPHVTIGDLGMVRDVTLDGATVHVRLTPTYTGCPATEQIRADVAAAVRANGYEPDISFELSPAWTTDSITDRGRRRLQAAGIAPPAATVEGSTGLTQAVELPVACPRCGSRRTRVVSYFGGTACKASHQCLACSEPFEEFKAI